MTPTTGEIVTPAGPNGSALQIANPRDVEAGSTARNEFGASQLTVQSETAAAERAMAARAEVEARFIVAMQRPRDLLAVHARIVRECKRPGFAEVARYRRPVGGGKFAEGPSIRFAEAAARCMGNLDIRTFVVSDTRDRQIVKAIVTDLETNASYSDDLVIEKFVERRSVRDGQTVLGSRTNSTGERVYLIEANEGELRTKRAAEISKAIRTLALRVVPGDIVEDAMDQVVETQKNRAAADPDSERKKIASAFLDCGVNPANLAEYLGHTIDQTTPAELVELRGVYRAIKDGQTTWNEVLGQKAEAEAAKRAAQAPTADAPKTAAAGLKEKVASKTKVPSSDEPGDLGIK